MGLAGIPKTTENALPLLHEIRHALGRLSDSGESTVLDLRAIPFGPGDEERVLAVRGEGEISARINTLGESRVWESRFPGVWLVEHFNHERERIALQIEVTEIPEILKTQRGDLQESLSRLSESLITEDPRPETSK
jgi:hydrogenase-1 operon protein HyaF